MYIDPITKNISVHGREALNLPYARWSPDGATQQDISGAEMYLEIPAGGLRIRLLTNSADLKGLRIYVPRAQVAHIPLTPTPYIIVDESDTTLPFLELEGLIFLTGYTEQPSG